MTVRRIYLKHNILFYEIYGHDILIADSQKALKKALTPYILLR